MTVFQISVNSTLAAFTAVFGYMSVIAGFFVHTILCKQPIVYKKIMETDNFKLADDTLEMYYKIVLPPFFIGYGFIFVVTVCVISAILTDALSVPAYFVLLNPFVFMIVGMLLRRINPNRFYYLPKIILPSLGLGMFGLIGIVSLMQYIKITD